MEVIKGSFVLLLSRCKDASISKQIQDSRTVVNKRNLEETEVEYARERGHK